MLKTLFRKQLLELGAWLYSDRKTGKRRSGTGLAGYIVLYVFVFLTFLGMFFAMADMLCTPLLELGLGWFYFALMGLVATLIGVFGSVFTTYSSLYAAKDNDLLLSLPVPPLYILAVRLFGVWFWGTLYASCVLIPTMVVYWMNAPFNALTIVSDLLVLGLLSLFILSLSCILGWVVAKINRNLKSKNLLTMVFSLLFLAAYFYFYSQAYELLQQLLTNAEAISQAIKSAIYPVYAMGRAGEGDGLSLLLFAAIILAVGGLVCWILARSFIKLATSSGAATKAVYREKAAKERSLLRTLMFKESRRFFGSPTYMLNCSLGTLLLPIAMVALLVKWDTIFPLLTALFANRQGALAVLMGLFLCLISSMNIITAPSISLEGKNLWLLQVLPVPAWQALKAKLYWHLLLTEPAVLLAGVCCIVMLRPSALGAVAILLVAAVFVLLSALFGLFVNLKSPNLHWTNETVPIKQSFSTMLVMLGGWAVMITVGALYLLVLCHYVSGELYLLLCAVVFGAIAALLVRWLQTKGARLFENLS